ncbi:MAG: LCP family protein [Lawsonibacter sp.]|jgi:LCP family protein required for cell wall assembly
MRDHKQTNEHGKREYSSRQSSFLGQYWKRYRAWLAGLTRGQRIRYRALQVATVIAILIIAIFLALRAWIRLPDVPDLPGTDSSQVVEGEDGVVFDGAQLPNVTKSGRKPGYYTFLVAGRDVASGSTDTILLFTFDTENKKLNALSIPRDTMINTSASSKRINAVYARNRGSSDLPEAQRVKNGMTALKQEVSKLTGIYPDFYVFLEWEAVGELVEALGGVYFDVPFDMDYDDPYQDLHIHQAAGYRKLNGEDAMEVVRWRKNNTGSSGGDVARIKVQQAFLAAVLEQCLQPSTLLKAPSLAQIFLDNVETDLSIGNILAFAQLAVGMDPEQDVVFTTVPYANAWYNGASMVTAVEDELLEILNSGMNPYVDEIQSSDLQLIYKKSNGSYGVTNGELADPKMGRVPSSGSSSTTKPEEEGETPILPDGSQGGSSSQTPDGSQGGSSSQTPDGSQGGSSSQTPDGSQGGSSSQTPGGSQGGSSSQTPDGSQSGSGSQAPDGSQGGSSSQTPTGSQSGSGSQTTGGEQTETSSSASTSQGGSGFGGIDPDQVLPDPNSSASQDIGGGEDTTGFPSGWGAEEPAA